ncbi:unnamed protein product [Moneuplotes crassus]|uniref:20 kDa chaperonin, chloroplastic n=2 Tax=Euplotes crassus TaxID=5936 RepID=A0AAD2D996_EUPCR|nr:unnamed protein product [Moneuplotes crassus]
MLNFRRIKPLMNRVLVKKVEVPSKSAGGILLKVTEAEKSNVATVIDVGPGTTDREGNFRKTFVNVGDIVLLPETQGRKIEMADKSEFYLYRDDDIIGVLSEAV